MPVGQKSKLPFARAYDFIMADRDLTPAEKLVVTEVCRYWPNPCYESAGTIADHCGLDARYVRNLIKGLCQGRAKRKGAGKTQRNAKGLIFLRSSRMIGKRANTLASTTQLLSAAQCARLCGVSRRSWFRLAASGKCPGSVRVGSSPRWRSEDLERWIHRGCPTRREFEQRKEAEQCA